MINAKGNLVGSINSKQELSGTLNKAVEYIEPVTQEKEVTPTKETQIVEPDKGYTGLSKVIVNSYTPVVDKKKITSNGIYDASDDKLDGYSQVEVETSGVDINDYFNNTVPSGSQYLPGVVRTIKRVSSPITIEGTSANYVFNCMFSLVEAPQINMGNASSMQGMFQQCYKLEIIPQIDTSNITNMNGCFYQCSRLPIVPISDTSKVTDMSIAFGYCSTLTQIPKLNCANVEAIKNLVAGDANLKDIGGFENLGQAYKTYQSANYGNYQLNFSPCPNLTHTSLTNIINNLYDIASIGVATQQLVLGSENMAKLTAEEIAIATNKGWTVS